MKLGLLRITLNSSRYLPQSSTLLTQEKILDTLTLQLFRLRHSVFLHLYGFLVGGVKLQRLREATVHFSILKKNKKIIHFYGDNNIRYII